MILPSASCIAISGAISPAFNGLAFVLAYERFKNKNFTVLGVSLDDNKADWLEAINNDKLNWLQLSDLKKWESSVVNTYQIEGIPFNVLVDPTGKIIATELRGQSLQETLANLFQ